MIHTHYLICISAVTSVNNIINKIVKLFVLTSVFFICCCNFVSSQSKQAGIIVADYDSITTTTQLLAKFKGKPVFLDLWAPWCEPCKDEFSHSDMLYKELQKRDIQMLYISLYNNVTDNAWRNDIYKYKLKGSHVKTNRALQDALTTTIWGASGGFSIPRYLLFDKNGKILLPDALPPSNGSKLLTQIDSVLKL